MTKAISKLSTQATADTFKLTTANNTAITVQATSPAPITVDVSNAWESFSARPSVAASLSALSKTKNGFVWVWESEQEQAFGRSVAVFLWQVFRAVALPLLSLVWLALNKGYVRMLAPTTRAMAKQKWAELRAWTAPKYTYDRAKSELNVIEK